VNPADKRAPLIALVGMPGGGKSTVGRHLAKRLDLPFVDSDAVIESRLHMSIRAYFDEQGEAAFRDQEQAAIEELCSRDSGVLATGGGAVLREANRQVLKERCTVVYLRSTPEELFRRMRHDTQRPLLQVKDPLARLRELYMQRHPLYESTADYIVDTGRPSVPVLVNMIMMQLELAGIVANPNSPA